MNRIMGTAVSGLATSLLREPMREIAERDNADEDAAGREHHEDDLAPLLGGRLDGQERVVKRSDHGRSLSQLREGSTRRSAKLAELFANSHQPCTCG